MKKRILERHFKIVGLGLDEVVQRLADENMMYVHSLVEPFDEQQYQLAVDVITSRISRDSIVRLAFSLNPNQMFVFELLETLANEVVQTIKDRASEVHRVC